MKRFVCFLLAMVMILGMIPMTAPTAYAASKWSTSSAAIEILKQYEGFQEDAYQVGGNWYIGYGSQISSEDDYPNGISKEDATKLLKEHVSETVDEAINAFTKKLNLDLSQNKHDALALFSYSYGTAWLSDASHPMYIAVRTGITGNDFINTIAQYHGGDVTDENAYFKGLMNRRLSEANLYLNNIAAFNAPSNYTYVTLDEDGDESADKVIAYDYNKSYTIEKLADSGTNVFMGWYVFDGKADGTVSINGQAVTKLNKDVAGKLLVAKFESENTNINASYKINTDSLVSRYVYHRAYTKAEYEANMSESKKGELKKDTTFTVAYEKIVDGIKWAYGIGKDTKKKELEGWVYLGELAEAGTTNDKPVATATITSTSVDIKEGATSSSTTLGSISKGVTVNIYQIKVEATATGNREWGKVNVGGVIGWINLAYADVKETSGSNDSAAGRKGKIIGAEEVNVRSSAGITATNKITTLKKGTEVTVLKTEDVGVAQWGYVEWDGLKDGYTKGWVYMNYVEVKGLEHTTPSGGTGETPKYTGVVTSNINLNVREKADIYSKKVGTLPKGTQVNVYETKTKNSMKWGRIGEDRWVCTSYLNMTEVAGSAGSNGATTTTTLQATVSAKTLDIFQNYNSNSAKIGTLNQGDVLTVLERNTENTETGSRIWGRIVKDGVEGWINLAYVDLKTITSVTGGTTTGSNGTVTSNSNGAEGVVSNCISVNVRSGAGVLCDPITKLNSGTLVKVYDRVTKDSAPWAKITWNSGASEGWVCMNYVTMKSVPGTTENGGTIGGTNSNTISATGTVNSNINLRVRSGAGLEYGELGSLVKGTKVTIYEQVSNNGMIWGRLNYNGTSGWVCMSYVTVDSVSTTGKGVMGTIARCFNAVNVRSAPGTGNALVGNIGVGKRVEVFETREYSGQLWGRVAQGWICMDYVLLDSELPPGTVLDATEPSTEAAKPTEPEATVNRDNEILYTINGTVSNNTKPLNVYNDTSDKSDKIGTINDGLPLKILAVKNNNAALWGRIDQYATAGWVEMSKIIYSVTGFINTDDQPVYADPSTGSTIKGRLNINTPVTITKLNADSETVFGWYEKDALAGWIPMGRVSDKETDVLTTYKSSLEDPGNTVQGTTNAAITAYNEPNGGTAKFCIASGITVYVSKISLENGHVWGKVHANGVEAWIDLNYVTYVINGTNAQDLKVYKEKGNTDSSNVLGKNATDDIKVCELSFDSNGLLWGKVVNNANELNGGYVKMTDIGTPISIEYK